ncbi:MAG: hypothetical protein ABII23_04435 [bacterium]
MNTFLHKTGNVNIIALFGLIISVLLAWYAVQFPQIPFIIITLGAGLAIIAFVKPELGLLVLVFSMLLSPEITLLKDPKHDLIIRLEDIFLIIVFAAWVAHTAINKHLIEAADFPLRTPIIGYTMICMIGTGLGIIRGELTIMRSFFYLLKYIEYFVLFFVAVNVIKKPSQVKMYLWAGLITCLIVTGYVYYTYVPVPGFRATAPFEGLKSSEPASLGGYYLIVLSMLMGFILNSKSLRLKILLFIAFVIIIPPFVFTQSRASYFAFIPMMIFLLYMSKSWKALLTSCIIMLILIPVIMFSSLGTIIKQRVMFTFSPGGASTYGNLQLEPSAATRVQSWKVSFTKWLPKHMFFGWGVTGVGLVDAQIPRILGETGLLGFFFFLLLIISLWRYAQYSLQHVHDPAAQSFSLGFLGAFVGILIQSITTNTFIIIRIMQPFWFLAALVILLPKIYPEAIHEQ